MRLGANERARMAFCIAAINDHKSSEEYLTAWNAELYYKHQNPTIMRYQKFVYDQLGRAVPDTWSPNAKIASNWYFYFTTQAVQYLLGNGVTFTKDDTKSRLGANFDQKIQKLATYAKNGGVSFGFWNYDHIDVFSLLEFVPIRDEESGALKAGIRFWQIDDDKPLRVTLYELDGYTDYIKRDGEEITVLCAKRSYKRIVRKSETEGETVLNGENYPGFPIVPLWNVNEQSDLVGNQETIDNYDLMQSGLVNNVSEGDFIYWVLKSYGDVNEIDAVKFREQIKLTHVAQISGDEGTSADAHQLEVPFEATEASLRTLEERLYKDFMALRVDSISAGSVTATQIEAAYEPLNQKTDQFESGVTMFILGILQLAGIDDAPTYSRSQMSNQAEQVKTVLLATEYLDDEYVTKKILTLLGDADQTDAVLERRTAAEYGRYSPKTNPKGE